MEKEERMNLLEDKVKQNSERLERHSKRLQSLEESYMKESAEINDIRTDVTILTSQLNTVMENQQTTNKKISSLDSKLDNHGKWLKFLALAIGVTLAVIFIKDSSMAKSIVEILALLKGGALLV